MEQPKGLSKYALKRWRLAHEENAQEAEEPKDEKPAPRKTKEERHLSKMLGEKGGGI